MGKPKDPNIKAGRYGNVIVYDLNGQKVVRTIGKQKHKATPAQLAYRAKFSIIAKFLSPIRHIITKSYAESGTDKSALGAASSYHMKEALIGNYPNFAIDFKKVIITKGSLLEIASPEVIPQPNTQLHLSWQDNSNQALANASEMLLVMVYNETMSEWYTILEGQRDAQHQIINLPQSWIGNAIHCWLAFYDETTKSYSTNIYVGPLVLQ